MKNEQEANIISATGEDANLRKGRIFCQEAINSDKSVLLDFFFCSQVLGYPTTSVSNLLACALLLISPDKKYVYCAND